MKRNLFLTVSTAAVVLASPAAFALDVSISGNVTTTVSNNETINQNDNLWTAILDGSGNVVNVAATIFTTTAPVGGSIEDVYNGYGNDTVSDAAVTETTDMDIDVAVSGSTSMMNYGGMIGVKAADGGTLTLDDAHVYMSTGIGKFEAGIDESGLQGVFDRDILSAGPLSAGMDVVNADRYYEDTFNGGLMTGTRVSYEHTIAGFSVAVAHDLVESDIQGSLGYSMDMGGASVALAAGLTSEGAFGARAVASMGDHKLAAGYADDDSGETSTYIGASTAFAGATLSLEYTMNEAADTYLPDVIIFGTPAFSNVTMAESNELVLGAAYSLAPGLTLSASVSKTSFSGEDDVTGVLNANWGDCSGAGTNPVCSSSGDLTKAAARLKLAF